MSAFAVSLLVLAGCGVLIVGAALLRMYGAERRRRPSSDELVDRR